MQFSCDKNVILKEISVAQEIIMTRNAISILSNVLLETDGDTLIIKATDLKVSFETRIPVITEKSGSTTIFCDKLLNILRTLPPGDVLFIQDENDQLFIKSGENIIFTLNSISSDKFPEFAVFDKSLFFSIPQKHFIEMVSHTVFAISEDETRYFMNGVLLERNDEKLVMVATDGRRLSYISKSPEAGNEFLDFKAITIPPKILTLVKKMASGEGHLKLGIADKMLFIHFDNQKMTSTLIDGEFPNYSRVIPESHEYEIHVNRIEFLDAIKRVSILSEQISKKIYISIHNNGINLKSEKGEIGIAEENLPCRFDGPDSTFRMNYLYLTEPMKIIQTDEVILKFTNTKKAFSLVSSPEETFFHILMPMQKGS